MCLDSLFYPHKKKQPYLFHASPPILPRPNRLVSCCNRTSAFQIIYSIMMLQKRDIPRHPRVEPLLVVNRRPQDLVQKQQGDRKWRTADDSRGRHTSYQHPKCRLSEKDDFAALSINMAPSTGRRMGGLKTREMILKMNTSKEKTNHQMYVFIDYTKE